jgi:adenosylhomocysteine nucleosidase
MTEPAPANSTPRICAIISADAEWHAVLAIFAPRQLQPSPYGDWFILDDAGSGAEVICLNGGWGKIAAAGSAQYAIDRWRPDLLVNLGTCGGFAGRIERGTILLAERTVVYDIVELMGSQDLAIEHYAVDHDLSWIPHSLASTVRRALLLSADRDLDASQVDALFERYGAIAGDWESGAIAWVARRNEVPVLILRGVSDLVGVHGGEAYDGAAHIFEAGAASVMERLFDLLPAWIAGFMMKDIGHG